MCDNNQNEFSREIRDRAHFLRYSMFESLETHLLRLESNLVDHKVNVRWAQDEVSLYNTIVDFLPQKQYNRVCVDMPYMPDFLKNREDNVFNLSSVESVKNFENEVDTLVVSADFAISENGSLVFFNKPSNECFNLINHLIVVVNIDQILASQSDLSIFLKLKSKNETAFPDDVKILTSSYNKIIADEFYSSDTLGFTTEPVTVSVILYENNISEIFRDASLRQSLYCIHCGRCLEVCPVAKLSSHISPIDIVKQNCYENHNRTSSIFEKTTLCGNCDEVCPVGIPIADLLVYEMNLVNGNVGCSRSQKLYNIMSKRIKLNKYDYPFLKWFFIKRFFGKNKTLSDYFNNQKNNFYNVIRNTPDKEVEDGNIE